MSGIKDAIKKIIPSWAWGRLRKARLSYEYSSYSAYTVTHRYGQITRQVEIHDGVAKDWYDRDWPELPELRFLEDKGILRRGAKVFDIGAHQCIVAMMIADIIGTEGHVWAVEPVEANVKASKRNLELNGVGNCTVLQGAVSNSSGRDPELGVIHTIDELSARFGEPDLIFVDIEGFETKALQGAARTLRGRSSWHIEVHQETGLEQAGSSVQEVVSFFSGDGRYDLFAAPLDQTPEPLHANKYPPGRFMFCALHRH